jgi:hypothetical protein
MKVENINGALRELFQELVNDGFKRRHVCGLTLGAQNEPQFDGFLKGNDFGIKPLQRLIQNMGYNFNVIIVPEENGEEIERFVNEVNHEFLATCKGYLVEKLGDEKAIKSASVAKTGIIADVSSELFDAIIK